MNHKVLLVDDDPNVLHAFKRQLRKQFFIETAPSPELGLEAIKNNGPHAVVVSDLRMPGMDGNEFLTCVKRLSPTTVRMLLTGYADFQSALKAINSGHIFRLLTKPCPPDTLADALTSGIEEYIRISKKTGSRDGGKTIRPAKKILVVDDNPVMGDMLTKALKDYDELSVLTSRNGKDAAGLLMNQRIDFVVTELAMPVMNGLKLLRYMKLRHPEIPAAVVTGLDKPDLESRIRALGNYSYFEKPMDINVLLALIFEEMDSGGVSQIHGISIAAFLQLVDTEKKTCTLTVREKNKIGYLYLLEGDLMAAETGHIQGEEAAYQIITWDKTIIEVENVCSKKDREIHLPLMMILMESARLKDEQRSGTLE